MSDKGAATAVSLTAVRGPGADAETVRDLFLEYAESLGYNTCFAGFEQELYTLPGDYGPPRSCLLLARADGEVAGCVGVRPLDEASCEMKRLYVRPQFRRARLGWKLADAAIARARAIGYRRMFLDTLPTMREARTLYSALGFKACPPYYDNSLLGSDCFELSLDK